MKSFVFFKTTFLKNQEIITFVRYNDNIIVWNRTDPYGTKSKPISFNTGHLARIFG